MSFRFLRPYQQATHVNFALVDLLKTDFITTVSFQTGDVNIIKDEGSPSTTTNLPVVEGSGLFSLALTATELQCKRASIVIKDQNGVSIAGWKDWEDEVIYIETYGSSVAQHEGDMSRLLNIP